MLRPVPKPEIVRDDDFKTFVHGLPCCCGCGRPGQVHHVKHRRGFGEKRNLVPLYHECHHEGHTIGFATWQRRRGVRLQVVADILWAAWEKAKVGRE